jgi:hypothetical protein
MLLLTTDSNNNLYLENELKTRKLILRLICSHGVIELLAYRYSIYVCGLADPNQYYHPFIPSLLIKADVEERKPVPKFLHLYISRSLLI